MSATHDLMEERSFAKRIAKDDQRLMYKLVDFIGWQEGAALGTPEQRNMTQTFKPWLYDRATGLVLSVPELHPVFAAYLYGAHKGWGVEKYDRDNADRFVDECLGWWLSSMSVSSRKIMVGRDVVLNAQERAIFRSYVLDRI